MRCDYVRKGGLFAMSIRWHALRSLEERMKLHSSMLFRPANFVAYLSSFRHYQDAYATLVIMFGSTAILPPRTKRWAEAKVLADCINVKVCCSLSYFSFYSDVFNLHFRCASSTYTTTNMRSRSRTTAPICESFQIFQEVGELGKRHMNFGVGWLGSMYLSMSTLHAFIDQTWRLQAPYSRWTSRTRNSVKPNNSFSCPPTSVFSRSISS